MGRMLLLATALTASVAGQARADRPTSGDMSLFSGRTMGNGEVVLAAGVGWPGLWAEALFAPSSTFNFGVQGGVLYGSPYMGFATGVGGQLAFPMRFHLYGHNHTDISLAVTPSVVLGEGALLGQEGVFGDDLGLGVLAEGGALIGIQPGESVTLTVGALAGFGWVDVFDGNEEGRAVAATFLGVLAIEALMSRDTMLFAAVQGGYGISAERLFDQRGIVRVYLGLAYLL